MKKNYKIELPEKIKVQILQHDSGVGYFAHLPEYDVFTEAESKEELEVMINDLIFELFDVPKALQSQIRFTPSKAKSWTEKVNWLMMMSTPEVFRSHYNVT